MQFLKNLLKMLKDICKTKKQKQKEHQEFIDRNERITGVDSSLDGKG